MVLDASVALAFALPDEDSEQAELLMLELEDAPVIAPTIWIYEIASGLRAAEQRQRLDAKTASAILAQFAELHVEFEHPDATRLVDISRDTGLSVYDASYIALCEQHHLPLASLDRRLMSVALTRGIAIRT